VRVGLQGEVVAPEDRKPARLTFVIDVSGSMADPNKLELVKPSLATMVGQLRPDDTVAIVVYGDEARLVLEPTPASDAATIVGAVDGLVSEGSTNAEAGLVLGYNLAREHFDDGAINRVVLTSDGVANVGETGPEAILARVQEEAGDGIQLVTVGFGMGEYNDVLMEQLADDGDGFYAYVDGPAEAERLFVHQLTGTLQTIAVDAKVQVAFDPATVASYRLLGYENRAVADEDFDDDTVDGGEVGAGHRVVALYEITVVEGTAADAVLATATARWLDPDTREPIEREAVLAAAEMAASFDQSAPHLQLDVMVAAWAETLRGAPWSQAMTLQGIADNSGRLVTLLPGDAQVAEFVSLTAAAAQLG
jgi:Ca-activated chloride channel homolog